MLLAKWLMTNPKLLILDEPTRGVDVGAKSMIHEAVKRHVNKGNAAIIISSDLMEVGGLSDRVLIYIMDVREELLIRNRITVLRYPF